MLTVSDLYFAYKFRPILKGVNFQLKPGEILQISGPNDCGKTTLMSILAGLIQESSGSITYSCNGNSKQDRRHHIEYLPAEANGLYGKMDAMENLRFWLNLRARECSDADIIEELKLWSLDHPLIRKDFPVEKYSTGMKRRLSLARVNLSQTPVWLLDEPLYGLDVKGIEQFQNVLKKHLENQGSAVLVSHDVAPLEMFKPTVFELKKQEAS